MELGAPGIDTPWRGTFPVTPCAPGTSIGPPFCFRVPQVCQLGYQPPVPLHRPLHQPARRHELHQPALRHAYAMRYGTIPGLQHRPRQRHRLDVLDLHQGGHDDLPVGRHLCVPKRHARVGSDADAENGEGHVMDSTCASV